MKKLLSIALSLLMVFSIIPMGISAFAYEESTVCVIGGNEYSSLFGEDGALVSAAEGDTIILVKDVKETGGVTLDKAVTIDLAGYSIINYSTEKIITTTKDLTVRSTVDGKGKTNTEAKSDFKYSGLFLTTSANFTASNVRFTEANNFPEYDTSTDFAEGYEWVFGFYTTSGLSDKTGLSGVSYNDSFRAATKTMIPVEAGQKYYFDYTNGDGKAMNIEVFGFDANGANGKKIGTYSKTFCTIPDGVTQIGINILGKNIYDYQWANSSKGLVTKVKDGTIKAHIYKITAVCATVASANAFVSFKADNITWKMDNSVYDQTTGTASLMSFTNAIKYDFSGSTFKFANWGGKDIFTINNSASSGTIKNCTFSGNNAHAVVISNVSATDGLTLDGCTITTSGDGGRTALTIKSGLVKLVGGTIGNTSSTNSTYFAGGTIIVDGTKFNGAKSTVVNISSSANVTIKSASFVKASTTIYGLTNFWNSLADGRAVYTSTTKSADTIVTHGNDVNALEGTFYVDTCEHYCASTQDGSTTCFYCLTENADIEHNYSSEYLYNATGHWHECQRCYGYSKTVAHEVGTSGTEATCTEKAVCGDCGQAYGEPIPHAFTDYVKDETHSCSHIEVKTASCDYKCGATETLYNGVVLDELDESLVKVTKEKVSATCTEDGATAQISCAECGTVIIESEVIPALGHDLGEVKFDNADGENKFYDSNYINEGWGYQECQRDGCDYVEEGVIPVKEFDKRTVAFSGGYDNPTEYRNLLGEDGAIAGAKDGDTIILLKDIDESNTVTIEKNITIDLAGHSLASGATNGAIITSGNLTIRSTVDGLGQTDTAEKADITYAKVFVKGSKVNTFSNVIITATAAGSFFTATATDAELNVKNAEINVASDSVRTALEFTTYDVKVDFDSVKIRMGSANNSTGLNMSKAVTGTFKDCAIYMVKGLAISISNANTNLTMTGCTVGSGGGDNWHVFSISGGTVTLNGGTKVSGGSHYIALTISGGNVTLDDAWINGCKGDQSDRVPLKVSGGNVKIKKARITKTNASGNIILQSGVEDFYNMIDENSALYQVENAGSGEFAYEYRSVSNLYTFTNIYVDVCNHDETTATCGAAGNCKFCNKAFDALGHDYSEVKQDAESGTHYKVCSRCGDIDETSAEVHDFSTYKRDFVKGTHYKVCSVCGLTDSSYTPEAHYGGTATCTELAKCDLCGYEYGEYAHVYTKNTLKYDADSHWVVCDLCGGGEKEAEEHHSDTIVCQHKQVCDTCDQEFGEVIQHNFNHYVSNNDATCLANGTETSKCAYGCKDADGNYITDTRTVLNSALGHNLVKDSGTAATCSKTGLTERVYCDRDGCTYVKVEETIIPIAKDAHLWDDGKFTSTGDCAHDCIYTYTCKHCGITKSYNYGKVPGKHVYSSTYTIDVKPTYFKTGVKSRHCKYCSAKTSVKKIAKLSPKVKITTSKGKIKVKYTKATGANYFQVRYKIGTKTVTKTYKSSKTVTKTIKNLKKGKYKVWVRAMYKKGSTKKYSSWTKAKAVKVK